MATSQWRTHHAGSAASFREHDRTAEPAAAGVSWRSRAGCLPDGDRATGPAQRAGCAGDGQEAEVARLRTRWWRSSIGTQSATNTRTRKWARIAFIRPLTGCGLSRPGHGTQEVFSQPGQLPWRGWGAGRLPEGAEAWFAIPRWQALAPTYNEAVEMVLGVSGHETQVLRTASSGVWARPICARASAPGWPKRFWASSRKATTFWW